MTDTSENPKHSETLHPSAPQNKRTIWEALEAGIPPKIPLDIKSQVVTSQAIEYLLEQWATLIIWNAADLSSAGEKKPLTLAGASHHYDVYDRGSCLVASPHSLYSHERTLVDALNTAHALGQEVYNRAWDVEFSGFDKMVTAAWITISQFNDINGKKVNFHYFEPSTQALKIYQASQRPMIKGPDLEQG